MQIKMRIAVLGIMLFLSFSSSWSDEPPPAIKNCQIEERIAIAAQGAEKKECSCRSCESQECCANWPLGACKDDCSTHKWLVDKDKQCKSDEQPECCSN